MKFVSKLKPFIAKRKKTLLAVFSILFLLLLFVISSAGSLRIFIPHYHELTGFPFGQKNYLIVFQNNQEMRPAGGFISSFATLHFTAGIPTDFQIEDVYGEIDEHPYIEPPYPMKELLANEWYKGYTFRDANYFSDYPQTVDELIRLYHQTRPAEQFDGVIAVNFNALEDLIGKLEPLKIDGKLVTKDNLFEEITNSVNDIDRHDTSQLNNRKSLLKPLATAIIKKLVINPFLVRRVSDSFVYSLNHKDIQLNFKDQNLQNLISSQGWSGAWPSANSTEDFLAVVEANLGGMKSDRYILRKITYHVRITEENLAQKTDPEATLELELQHFGIENIPLSGPYSGYFRFYKSPDNKLPVDEIIKLQPGEKNTITKKFTVPYSVIKDRKYSLYLAKQSGAEDFFTVIVELPRGLQIDSTDFQTRENFAVFEGFLTRDKTLQMQILPDQNPPILYDQENTELNKISLHFNEDLNQSFASDPFSYEVKDLDQNVPQTTDKINIKEIKTTSKDVDIYLTGQTNQPEERYGVHLKNLRDTKGNILTDRWITVVQRLK
jgi:hypothetical protein